MTRKSRRELERAVDDLSASKPASDTEVELTDTQARAVREYDLYCDRPGELDDDLEAALYEVAYGA
ncbi:hypothetical protein [Haloarcula onubensis]|uniref:Uncharacterized protein n=1 Tax=Haloarcula onubensis TaxID=2950539 RepID=A0ABU2FX59_9EURY|nr:hypothetical protein [Halomicroarcula sp. S3CR25-11]MDS0284736.1 hypothetical protein [Halomicroarcula sp. S3CR25-11]